MGSKFYWFDVHVLFLVLFVEFEYRSGVTEFTANELFKNRPVQTRIKVSLWLKDISNLFGAEIVPNYIRNELR